MRVGEIETHPGPGVLDGILKSSRLRIVSPFVSAWGLSKIPFEENQVVKLITRLPQHYQAPVAYLDNDPRPFRDAMQRMGTSLQLYALPSVHAKLYLNDEAAWAGSANFTRNGFSRKEELLLKIDKTRALDRVFETYMRGARASRKKMSKSWYGGSS